jgi:hypothetical protein
MLKELGFDGVKLDACSAQLNMTLYAELMKATGTAFEIENCHWGGACQTLPPCHVTIYEKLPEAINFRANENNNLNEDS